MIHATKGRGSSENSTGRFELFQRESVDDGWGSLDGDEDRLKPGNDELTVTRFRPPVENEPQLTLF